MPTKTAIRKMSKPQLVDFACDFFEDEGNLRSQMEELARPQLIELLLENDAHEEPESRITPVPEVEAPPKRDPADLGSF